MDELRRIEAQIRQASTLDELRSLFDRVQMLRRAFADDFDLQLAIANVQHQLVERGRLLQESSRQRRPVSEEQSLDEEMARANQRAGVEGEAFEHDLPPGVQQMDARSWTRVVYVGIFFAVVLFAGFFYLIQMARKLNLAPAQQAQNAVSGPNNSGTTPLKPASNVPPGPTLRLYTDLVPGTVSIDGAVPQDLQDGELQLDSLKPGRHNVQVNGRTGRASFDFDVPDKGAPRLAAAPSADNAMVVTVSTSDGKGEMRTNESSADALIDNKPTGTIAANGLALENLGVIDHDLEIKRAHDQQRFILTYTPAPALTVFVKSDPNAGSLVVVAGEDNADVYLNDKMYRRKTDRGQLRIPSLTVGKYTIKVRKAGFLEAPPQTVEVKKGEEGRVEFHLQLAPQVATLQIHGAQPGTTIFLDHEFAATVGVDGNASIAGVKAGNRSIELRHEGWQPKHIDRFFKAGDIIQLAGPDVVMERVVAENVKPVQPPPPVPVQPAPAAPAEAQPTVIPASVRKGGGFVVYNAPKSSGHYSFTAQLRKGGGFLKSKRLQWFLSYQDPKNYVVFQVDGKHFTVRDVADGKSRELQKVPFGGDPEENVQVEISVKPNSVDTKVRTPESGWQDLGTVSSAGRDFTQGKFGFLIPGNDEVGISTVHFGK